MALHFHVSSNILHSQASPDWYTPTDYVEAAREVMGGIDLDPASDAEANLRVKATQFFTEQENGLKQPWAGRVFLNPPGKDQLVSQFWRKLMDSVGVSEFIWVGYSLEQLQTLQNSCNVTPLMFPICIPRKRIAFIENEAKKAARIAELLKKGKTPNKKSSPTHANYIVYSGPKQEKFAYVFQQFGVVRLWGIK